MLTWPGSQPVRRDLTWQYGWLESIEVLSLKYVF